MKILYKKKNVNGNLILGIVWLVFGTISIVFGEGSNPLNFAWLLLAGVYLVLYFYQKNEKYLTIKNGIIRQNGPL